MKRRILVTGSRNWTDRDLLERELLVAIGELAGSGECVIVHGACPRGADRMADEYAARILGVHVERHPAEWSRLGRSAGFIRNAVMVTAGADLCLAFIRDGSHGASHTAYLAEKVGIETRRFLA